MATNSKQWNPHFVSYAKAHGRTPSKQLEHDDEAYPGGKMCGFIVWMGGLMTKFKTEHPEHCIPGKDAHVSDRKVSSSGLIELTKFIENIVDSDECPKEENSL
jgi:hypothetical protein